MERRQPTADELIHVDTTLRRLHEHFHEWPHYEGREHELLEFALYEGFANNHCSNLIAEAAPFALGRELVNHHGFQWVMVRHENGWHFAVSHKHIEHPVDLQLLEDGRWDDQDGDYDEPPSRGERTIHSLDLLVRASKMKSRGAT